MIRLKVREIAERKKVSQSRLSRLADIDVKTLRKVYQSPDTVNITLDTLNKLAFALKVDAHELFDYERDDSLPGLSEE